MSETKEITISCDKCEVTGRYNGNKVTVTLDFPDVQDMLGGVEKQDIVDFIGGHYSPMEIFDEKELIKWAENNGYVKE